MVVLFGFPDRYKNFHGCLEYTFKYEKSLPCIIKDKTAGSKWIERIFRCFYRVPVLIKSSRF